MTDEKPGLQIEVGGKVTVVHIDSLTGRDVKDFRGEVGFAPRLAFTDPSLMDIDVIAGFLWLQRRKLRPSLTYDEVLDSMTYDNIKVIQSDVDEDDDPEA